MDFKKNALLNTNNMSGYDFEKMKKIICNKDYIKSVMLLLNEIFSEYNTFNFDTKTTKNFLTAYMIK